MIKKLKTLEREVKSGNIAPVYVLTGNEHWSKERFVALLKKSVIDPSMTDFNFEQLDATTTKGLAVVDKACVMPMMADRRMIVVENCDKWKKIDLDKMLGYFDQADAATCLVLLFEAGDNRKKFFRANPKVVRYLDFPRPKPWELNDHIREMSVEMGLKLTSDALHLMAELVGDNLAKVQGELEKLHLYKLNAEVIEADDVEAIMGRTRQVTRWELGEYIGQRRLAEALVKMHDILDSGDDPISLLSAINMSLKQMFTVKALMTRGMRDKAEIARTLGLKTMIAERIIHQQQAFSSYELRRAFDLMREADYKLKSAGIDRALVLDHLLSQILPPGEMSPPRMRRR